MKTENFTDKPTRTRLLKRIGKQLSIDRVFDQFQGAIIYVDQFGFCAGLTMGLFALISVVLQASHSGAEKGVL